MLLHSLESVNRSYIAILMTARSHRPRDISLIFLLLLRRARLHVELDFEFSQIHANISLTFKRLHFFLS